MKISLYVHDFFLEIGHSRSLIEIVRNFPADEIESVDIVAFTCGDLSKIFPQLSGKVKFTQVPFNFLYPMMLKIIFYQVATFLHALFRTQKDDILLGVGVASLSANTINLQFVHNHYYPFYFRFIKKSFFSTLYKRIFFSYLNFCENYLYKKSKVKIVALSNFTKEFCQEKFKLSNSQIKTIYSGINIEEFNLEKYSREQYLVSLQNDYPELKNIDHKKPIHLFVGAFERKGLPFVFKSLKNVENPQLIIIGKPESNLNLNFPKDINISYIKFTTEIKRFYTIADSFIFPTIYEPFGLVLIEAAAMGLDIYTTAKNVGASELLGNIDNIFIFDDFMSVTIDNPRILSYEEKIKSIESRREVLNKYSWNKSGSEFYEFIKNR